MIELTHVKAGYDKRNVLKDVSVCLQAGKLTAIIGANGCGKSTLLKTVMGTLPREGSVLVDGTELSHMSRIQIAQKIAYLAQGKSTADMTVGQLVLHGRFPYLTYPRRYTQKDRQMAQNAMEQVGISGLSNQSLGSLSGGMRQTAYIAMVLAQNTEYILLDEPTTYLDVSHQLQLMRLLRSLVGQGKGIVAVMHDLPLALSFSDSIIVMDEGGVVIQGSPEEIYNSDVIPRVFGVFVEACDGGSGYYITI